MNINSKYIFFLTIADILSNVPLKIYFLKEKKLGVGKIAEILFKNNFHLGN